LSIEDAVEMKEEGRRGGEKERRKGGLLCVKNLSSANTTLGDYRQSGKGQGSASRTTHGALREFSPLTHALPTAE